MPEEYRIDLEKRVIWTRCWGVLSDQDIDHHRTRLAADPQFEPTLSELVDSREVSEVTVSAKTMGEMGQSQFFAPESKRAFVVEKDVMFGLVRMYALYQSLRGKESVRGFRNYDEAVAWICGTATASPEI